VGWRFCALKSFPNFQGEGFDCGDEEINNYLKNLVETADEAGFSRTFLMISESGEAK
jgi:alkanesulfonate monooxygenase SsuD/methylene tetrahydromethanopterin reductase-like flavin-dependent oxidoreductase (luciferase family)